jgi:dipeptidyl aminopeptidase/acylaminoacyl peptidase
MRLSPETALLPIRALALAAACLLPVPAFPQAAAPIPVERFFQRPAVLDAKLSPSGQRIAVTTSRNAPRVSLAVVDLATRQSRIVASFNDADVWRFDWTSDDRLVFNVIDLESGSAEDRRYAPGLFSVKADGDEFRWLVRRRGRAVTDGRQRDDRALEWHHTLLHVPLQQPGVEPDEVVIGELAFGRDTLEAVRPLWLNTRSGRTRPLDVGDAPKGITHWLFDSKGDARVARRDAAGRVALHWRPPGQAAWQRLYERDAFELPYTPHSVADDGTFYVEVAEGPEGYEVLTTLDRETLAQKAPPLIRAPGFDVDATLLLDRPGARALGARVDVDAEGTYWFDPALKDLQAEADRRLPGRVNRIQCRRCGQPDMVALVRSYADRDPGSILFYEAATKRLQLVATALDDVDVVRMATVDLHRVKARDGRDLPVWVTTPAGLKKGSAAPAVVLVHGGPWVRGWHWRWDAMSQFIASRGYVVIAPEFRGSRGYGSAHYRAGFKQWGRAMQDDVADALLWAQAKGIAGQQACIAGASYGGYATLMGLARHPELYRCGIAWVAVTDLALYLEGSWWIDDDISGDGRAHYLPVMVGDPKQDAEMLAAHSPLQQAARIRAPLLLAHGESDRRVPLAHAERLRSALTAAGRAPEWVTYPNEGHSWRLTSTQVDFARRIEAFLARHLAADGAPK